MKKIDLHQLLMVLSAAVLAPAGCFFGDAADCALNPTLACFWEGQGGSGGTGGSPPGCTPSEKNKEIDEVCGAFVSPTGSDANGDGTKGNPYLTIGKAAAEKPRVYACADADKPFDEAVAPKADVVIYGGFDCANADWPYDPTKKSAWTAPADSVPLTVSGEVKVEVYDFEITARDAAMAGGSSLAVLAAGDKAELVLERCEVVAGAGKDGVTPEQPAGTGQPGGAGKDGADGCVDLTTKVGGDAGTNICDAVSYEGGPGGNGTTASGGPGGDGKPQPGTAPNDGLGGKGQDAQDCTTGHQGGQGTNGDPGTGAVAYGTLTATGYQGATGGDGMANATPGQGGGGGGGAKVCTQMSYAGPGGGGGGAGGCPGMQVGKGGGPGGASIGVASVGAAVTLTEVQVTTNKGGAGGTGGDGQSGGKGGNAGNAGADGGDGTASACSGGKGGKGGDAGPGGGGQGGHSIGIAFTGTAPVQTKVVLSPGVAGPGGVAGANNVADGTKGADGQACQTFNFDDGTCTP